MSPLVWALLLIAGGVLGMFALEAFIRRPVLAAGAVFAMLLWVYSNLPIPFADLGGVSVYAYDVLTAALVVAATARVLRLRPMAWPHLVLIGFVAIGLFALARGIAEFGLTTPVNEARRWIWVLAIAAYFTTVNPRGSRQGVLDSIGRVWMWLGAALAAIAALRWGVLALGLPLDGLFRRPDEAGLRVHSAEATIIIVQAFFIAVAGWNDRARPGRRRLALALLPVIVLLQHRTVWIAMAVGIGLLMWRDRSLRLQVGVYLPIAVLTAVLLIVALLGSTTDEFGEQAADPQTLGWRYRGWVGLIEEDGPQSSVEVLAGRPFGTGFTRVVDAEVRTEKPHSLYLETFLRFGALGLALLLILSVAPLRCLPSSRLAWGPARILTKDVVLYILVTQLVFAIPYEPPESGYIALGLALGALAFARTDHRLPSDVVA